MGSTPSFPRKREPMTIARDERLLRLWVPAFAGTTEEDKTINRF